MSGRPLRVAVVGAGVAGLACADRLRRHGATPVLFDKGRGPGGRVSTRRAEGRRFDHGAQYLTARDPAFVEQAERWCAAGVAAPWTSEILRLDAVTGTARPTERGGTLRFVGAPDMSAVPRSMTDGLEVNRARIERVERAGGSWTVFDDHGAGRGPFDALVTALPCPQATALLHGEPAVSEACQAVVIAPCWCVMAGWPRGVEPCVAGPLSGRVGAEFGGAFVEGSALGWIANNGSKPGRPSGAAWILHATPRWSREHLEDAAEDVGRALLVACGDALGGLLAEPDHLVAHRWRFARTERPLGRPCLALPDRALVVCGDWCLGERVEDAWRSGCAAADALLR